VESTVTHRSLIRQARQEIRGLKRPPDVRRDMWHHITVLLNCLAGYLPEAFPSQRTLATKLDWNRTTVSRTVTRARNLGLITTAARPLDRGYTDGTTYLLVCLSTDLKAAIQRARPGHTSRTHFAPEEDLPPTEEDRSALPPPEGGTPVGACGADPSHDRVVAMSDYRDDPDPIGADPTAPLAAPRSTRPADQGVWLAKLFDECWRKMARSHREWAGVRPSSRPIAIRYIKGVMLEQVDVEVAEAYIRSYAPAVADGRCEPKLGQVPFQHFVGWWGSEEIEDPAVVRERKAEYDEAMRVYRLMKERESGG
jgi:hypothetical protein